MQRLYSNGVGGTKTPRGPSTPTNTHEHSRNARLTLWRCALCSAADRLHLLLLLLQGLTKRCGNILLLSATLD